ncbi:hypothetical protein HPP92_017793 [Vanilla planifolia]|uniref:HMA domain-containing protein n=1 Tax=Vanilla planifolia TaxID=51239 RepID=A0A835QD28_VANPL|nr:hypothetical protein HPP92_017793 [Vanilla planifolia]
MGSERTDGGQTAGRSSRDGSSGDDSVRGWDDKPARQLPGEARRYGRGRRLAAPATVRRWIPISHPIIAHWAAEIVPTRQQPLPLQLLYPTASSLVFFTFLLRLRPSFLMASGAEASEPLKYQTWVLKVSIHCEGCKKKVKKVLQGIDGVYKITVDAQQQKVTVTGNVDANLLIKKLCKAGKHAELWAEKNPTSQNAASASATSGKKNTKSAVAPSGNPDRTYEEEGSSASDKPAAIACEAPKKTNEMGAAAPSPPQEKLAGDEADKPSRAVAAKRK